MGFSSSATFFALDSAQDWISENIQQDPIPFLSTLWQIWRNRNKAIFNLQETSIWESVASANSLISITRKVFLLDGVVDQRPPRLVKWRAPLDDQIAINTDGSVNQHGTGFGGILRNANGSWIKGFYGHLHNSDILRAELHAVWKGLELCWRLNFRNLLSVRVRALLDRDWNVEVVHTLREGNQAADFLAKKGTLELSSFILLHDPPVELRDTLLADSLGTSFVRT
ncbi:Ribonuclease H-like superfamily [Sesbania bispinosa]|nr:Ribonuclease H-like superfamily [Sesbania bispinosa]